MDSGCVLSPFSKDEENEDDDDDVVMVWQTDADGSLSSAWLQFVDIIKCSLSVSGRRITTRRGETP